MTGFQAPNYTQVPNDFFIMARDMDKAELKVVLYIIRETFGYHRETCEVSIRELAIGAGLTARNAYNGAEKAIERGLVEKTVSSTHKTTWRAVVAEDTALYPLRQRTVSLRKSKPPVKEIKETKEKEDEQAQVFRAYSSEIGILTPMIADSINEWIKDGFPIKWMCDAIHEAALQNKRNWKYCEAIIKRWDAQGSQEEMKKPVNGYKQKPNEPKAFEAIREFMKSQGVDNGDITGNIQDDSAYQRGVPQLECKPIHDPSLL